MFGYLSYIGVVVAGNGDPGWEEGEQRGGGVRGCPARFCRLNSGSFQQNLVCPATCRGRVYIRTRSYKSRRHSHPGRTQTSAHHRKVEARTLVSTCVFVDARDPLAPPPPRPYLNYSVFSSVQVRVAVDLKAPSIKAGEPIIREVFRGGIVEPGALDPRQADILASTMAGRMHPPPPPGGVGPGVAGAAAVSGVAAADVGPGFNGPGGVGSVGAGPRGMGGRRGGGRGRGRGHRPGKF